MLTFHLLTHLFQIQIKGDLIHHYTEDHNAFWGSSATQVSIYVDLVPLKRSSNKLELRLLKWLLRCNRDYSKGWRRAQVIKCVLKNNGRVDVGEQRSGLSKSVFINRGDFRQVFIPFSSLYFWSCN